MLRYLISSALAALIVAGCASPEMNRPVDLERDIPGYLREKSNQPESEIVTAVFDEYLDHKDLYFGRISTHPEDLTELRQSLAKIGSAAILVQPEDLVFVYVHQFADSGSGERCHVPIVSGIFPDEGGFTVILRDLNGAQNNGEIERYSVSRDRPTGKWQATRTEEYHFMLPP